MKLAVIGGLVAAVAAGVAPAVAGCGAFFWSGACFAHSPAFDRSETKGVNGAVTHGVDPVFNPLPEWTRLLWSRLTSGDIDAWLVDRAAVGFSASALGLADGGGVLGAASLSAVRPGGAVMLMNGLADIRPAGDGRGGATAAFSGGAQAWSPASNEAGAPIVNAPAPVPGAGLFSFVSLALMRVRRRLSLYAR